MGNRRRKTFAFRITLSFIGIAALAAILIAGVTVLMFSMGPVRFSEDNLLIGLLLAGAISVVVAVFASTFFAGDMVRMVDRISKAAMELKDGNLGARTYLIGDDELSQLGETFDAMAESIERDRDLERQLIGDVAHELRTPLMAIQATVEAIQDGVLPADEERLSTIVSETRRLGRLVEALLHLNRLENGTIVAKSEELSLSDHITELGMNHQILIESSELAFETDIEPGILVKGDKDLLRQATANLLSNAVRYTPDGTITLILRREGSEAVITVRDTGIGISKEDQKKVFSRFWRADSARNRANGGLGIGLALVKEVVDQHHGVITLESEAGKGSAFSIHIPLSPNDPAMLAAMDRNTLKRVNRAAKKEQDRLRKEQRHRRREASGFTATTTGMFTKLTLGAKKATGQVASKMPAPIASAMPPAVTIDANGAVAHDSSAQAPSTPEEGDEKASS